MKSVIVPYPATNSTVRTRALHWIDRLAATGRIDRGDVTVHGPGFDSSGRTGGGGPVLLIRNARKLTRGGAESKLLRRGEPGVYDLDDGLPWDDGNLPGLGRWWKRPFPRSLVARRAVEAADRVIVGNEVLAEWAAKHCGDVRIVPTCVEASEYRRRHGWEIGESPTIGWIGSPATEPYLRAIAPALAEMANRHGARFELISGPGEPTASLAAFTTRIEWRPDAVSRLADWDIGVMPLADGVYERAKCGYKLLQYASAGVPAVASPVGVNRTMLDTMDGLAATSLDDWIDALDALLTESAARRAERARRGFELADAYSYDAWESTWIDAVGW